MATLDERLESVNEENCGIMISRVNINLEQLVKLLNIVEKAQ